MIKACVFDAFGTLFNLDIPIQEVQEIAQDRTEELMKIWRAKQLEYSWLRAAMQSYIPFNEVTHQALEFAMNETGIKEVNLFELLMPIYNHPITFPNVKPVLQQLKTLKIKTAILSNGTPEMLLAGINKTGIDLLIDQVLSVDEIKTFKPNPKVYAMACEKLDLKKSDIFFISSNRWDIAGAGTFGLRGIWLNQYQQKPEVLGPPPFKVIQTLEELPQLVNTFNTPV